jgi:hypothetical protein
MSSSVGSFVCEIRNFIDQGFRSLPTILANCVLLLGLLQGNLTYIFFFTGLFAITLFTAGLNETSFWFLSKFFPNFSSSDLLIAPTGGAEQCLMFPVFPSAGLGGKMFVVASYWITIVTFFFTYLITNAAYIYTQEPQKDAPNEAIRRRKFQTGSSMFILAVFYILFMILRYATSGCETPVGTFVGILLGGATGYAWYEVLRTCGLGQFDDIFGIQTQMLKS